MTTLVSMRPAAPLRAAVLVLAGTLALAACAPAPGGNTVSRGSLGTPSRVAYGEVIDVRAVNIEGQQSGKGALAGAAVGAATGVGIAGGTTESIVGGVAGAAIGGLAGNAIERRATTKNAFEYTIRDSNGQVFNIVQGGDAAIPTGTRVQIVYGDRVRIVPDNRGFTGAPAYRDPTY
ncbi:MAG: hypothetical protein ACFB6R_10390 [Alphaproteobacteria bacterium]